MLIWNVRKSEINSNILLIIIMIMMMTCIIHDSALNVALSIWFLSILEFSFKRTC